MMHGELGNHKDISKTIDGGVEKAQVQTTPDHAKQGAFSDKYDVLDKVITKQPHRKETMAKLKSLNKGLDYL